MLATNNLGVVGTSNSVAFQTLGEAQPGLFEVQIDGYNEYGPVDEAAKTNVVLRAVRAYAGTDPSVFPTYTTFAYLGQLYLPVGTFTFYSYCDDSARISIDGKIVCAKDVNGHQGTVTTTEPGWHDIDIRMSGAGGNNGTTDGAHFKAQGASTWQKFIDPGDGSLLRVNKTDTRLEIVSAAMMGTTLTAPVHAAIPEPADFDFLEINK